MARKLTDYTYVPSSLTRPAARKTPYDQTRIMPIGSKSGMSTVIFGIKFRPWCEVTKVDRGKPSSPLTRWLIHVTKGFFLDTLSPPLVDFFCGHVLRHVSPPSVLMTSRNAT